MLLSLPNELLTHIGFYLATSSSSCSPRLGPPSDLLPLLLSHPILNLALSFDRNPTLYSDILKATFDTAAITRRFGSDVLDDSSKGADELKARWTLLKRIRTAAEDGRPVGVDTTAQDLMQCFLMITENDGRNLPHLLLWAKLPAYLMNFHHNVMIPKALEPGYPDDTPDKALNFTIAALLDEANYFTKQSNLRRGDSMEAPFLAEDFIDTPAQTDEAVFVMRPFALALHKFDAYYAPWIIRQPLPLPPSVPRPSPVDSADEADPHVADNRPRLKGVHMTRFNRDYLICPPTLCLSASQGLMNQLDRNPCIGGLSDSSSNSSTASLDFLYPTCRKNSSAPPFVAEPSTGTYLRQSVPLLKLPSEVHDLDVKRLMECSDPWKGGLDALAFRGKLEGTYHGGFSFFDFAGYRDMLGGNVQALYDGTFGQQAQQIILTERVVRIHRSLVGGTGPIINAGFPLPDAPQDPYTLCYSREEEEAPEPEGSEYVKELWVDGAGRSGWGDFKVTGRVRAWDGMVILVKEYVTRDASGNEPSTRGKWLYRGYLLQESRFVGTWRDCFTDVGFRGYEGSFHMRRQAERFLVPLSSPSRLYNSPLPYRPLYTLSTDPSALSLSPSVESTTAVHASSSSPTPIQLSCPASSLRPPAAVDHQQVAELKTDLTPETLQKLHHSGFQGELSTGVIGSEPTTKRKRSSNDPSSSSSSSSSAHGTRLSIADLKEGPVPGGSIMGSGLVAAPHKPKRARRSSTSCDNPFCNVRHEDPAEDMYPHEGEDDEGAAEERELARKHVEAVEVLAATVAREQQGRAVQTVGGSWVDRPHVREWRDGEEGFVKDLKGKGKGKERERR